MLRWTTIALWTLSLGTLTLGPGAAPLLAQAPRPSKTAEPPSGSGSGGHGSGGHGSGPESRADTYTESASRDLFTSCDANSDDRLDLFETCEAFDTLRGVDDHQGFARLDKNRDGFVGWSEFDQHFQATLKQGNTLRVRSCRRLVQQAPEHQEARPATPVQTFLQLFDANQNGGLDPTELEKLAFLAALFRPGLGAQLRSLDVDRSGRVEESELAPIFPQLQGLLPQSPVPGPGTGSPLVPPWKGGDKDHDGTIDEAELITMLQSLDPNLARWSAALLRRLDRNRDARLSAAELPLANGTFGKPAAATTAAPLPKQTPVR